MTLRLPFLTSFVKITGLNDFLFGTANNRHFDDIFTKTDSQLQL